MKTKLLIVLALFALTACGRVDKDNKPVTASDTNDLTDLKQAKADSAVAKTERVVRKLRLAELMLSKKFALVSKTKTTANLFSACLTDAEQASTSEWNWLCNTSGASGKSYFTYSGSALQKIEQEISTTITDFGNAREVMNITDITDSTALNGQRTISFKMTWDFYKNLISDQTQVCEASTALIKINVEERDVLDSNGNVVKDKDGNPIKEQYANTITIDRLSMHCDQNFTTSSTDDTYVELKNSTLNISGSSHLLEGSLNFEFRDSKLTYAGVMKADGLGLTEPSEGKTKTWSCVGSPLCFP